MIKLPVILASVIAAVPCHAQDVRVFSGSQEHVYGPGGQLVDSPELRAKNERARQMYEQDLAKPEQQRVPIQQNGAAAQHQAPKSWWDRNGYKPPKSAWTQ